MAIIKITPLNSNGISPKNILTDLFEPLAGTTKTLIYPMDLATNPSFSHAVQFTVFDYTTELTNELEKLPTTISNITTEAANLAEGVQKNGFIETAKAAVNNLNPSESVQAVSKFLRGATYQTKANKPLGLISLYMPDNLTTSYDSNYTTVSMTETFGAGGYIANALADKNFTNKVASGDVANILNTPEGKYASSAALGAVVGGLKGVAKDATNLISQAAGIVPNPQMQLIYQGIGLREFQLDFIFTPISAQEAKMVDNIINAFTYFSVPDVANETGQYLVPPQVFRIKFAFTGNPGVLGAVQNVFTNTLSNILGSGAAAALQGSGEALIESSVGNTGNAKIFKVGDCVLKNVAVDYAPNGWATYGDGHPIQTRLTLQFQEMDIVTKKSIKKWTGFSAGDNVNSSISMPSFNDVVRSPDQA